MYDRRPWTATLSLYGAGLTHCPLTEYYTSPEAYALGQSAVLETFRPDVLFAPFALSVLGETFGGKLRYLPDQAPNLREPAGHDVDELVNLLSTTVELLPRIDYFRQSIELMRRYVGNDVPIAAIGISPFDLPAIVIGMEAWLDVVLFRPETVPHVLDLSEPLVVAWVNTLFDAGAGCVVLPGVFTSPRIVTTYQAKEHALPALQRVLPQIDGPVILHHAGAGLLPFMPLLAGLAPDVAGYAVNHDDSMGDVRRSIGSKAALLGGVDGPTLSKVSRETVVERATTLLRDRRHDPYYILSTSSADVPIETPAENIFALREAVERDTV